MSFINFLLDETEDDLNWDIPAEGISEVAKDRARQLSGINPDELFCLNLD